jgi:hypothetical protein
MYVAANYNQLRMNMPVAGFSKLSKGKINWIAGIATLLKPLHY